MTELVPPPDEREALATVLAAHFDRGRLSAAGVAYLYATMLPSAVLWVHAWHPLPDLAVWLAVLGWGSCGWLAVVCGWGAWRCRGRLRAALEHSRSMAHVRFAPADAEPLGSSFLLLLSVSASAILWLHGLAPTLVTPALVVLGGRAWALLLAAALGNRYVEALS
jgi:hypothetical protein